jgi:hypothetical protein
LVWRTVPAIEEAANIPEQPIFLLLWVHRLLFILPQG